MAGLSPAAQQVLRPSLCFAGGSGSSAGGVAVSVASSSRSSVLPSFVDDDGAPTSTSRVWNAGRDLTPPPPPPRSESAATNFDDVASAANGHHHRLTSFSRTGSSPATSSTVAATATYDFDDDDGDNEDSFDRRRRHTFNRIATESRRESSSREDLDDFRSGVASGSYPSDVRPFEGQLIYNPDGTLHVVDDPSADDFVEFHEDAIIERRDETVMGPSLPSYPPLTHVSVHRKKSTGVRDDDRRSSPPVTYRVLDRPSTGPEVVDVGESFLACFICRLSFDTGRSLAAHCRTTHAMGLDDVAGAGAVLYGVGTDRKPVLSFLEPTAVSAATSRSPTGSRSPPHRDDDRCLSDTMRSVADEISASDTCFPSAAVQRESDVSKQRSWLPYPTTATDDDYPPASSSSCLQVRASDVDETCDAGAELATSLADHWRRLNGAVVPTTQSDKNGSCVEDDDSDSRRTPNRCPLSATKNGDNETALHDSVLPSPSSNPRQTAYLTSSMFGRPVALPLRRDSPSHHPDELSDAPTRFDVPAGCTFGAPTAPSLMSRNSCKTLKCPKCNWHYKYQETLEIHMREKHPDGDATCVYCAGGGPHPRLARGESYTCGYKPYRCDVCNYSTTTKGNLSIHLQSDKHTNNVQELQNGGVPIPGGGSGVASVASAAPSPAAQDPAKLTAAAAAQAVPTAGSGSGACRPSTAGAGYKLPKPSWRCDFCGYETTEARNLRIHMTSEKHAHNLLALQQSAVNMHHQVLDYANSLLYGIHLVLISTDGVRKVKQSVASVCPSVRLSLLLFPLCLSNRLMFELEFCLCVGLKIKVIRQGQRSMFSAYGRGNAVGLTSVLDRGQFF